MAKGSKGDNFGRGKRKMRSGVAPLSRFRPHPDNPRTHPPAQLQLLAELLKTYDCDQPIVVDEDWWILKGHGRLTSAHMAGLEDFPYVQRLDLSEDEKVAMRIEDNQLPLLGGWNRELISAAVTRLDASGYPVMRLGFGEVELVQFRAMPALPTGEVTSPSLGSLADRFGVVPFSVLNAREGWWQDRKRAWIALGIQSELGRGENLLKFSETLLEPDPQKRKQNDAQKEAQR